MKIGVIGCGNMASVVTNAIYRFNKQIKFITYDIDKVKSLRLANSLQGTIVTNVKDYHDLDYLLVCCKPQHYKSLEKELQEVNLKTTVMVSIMASIPIERLKQGTNAKEIVRLMPSMPMAQDQGIALLFGQNESTHKSIYELRRLLIGSAKVYIPKTEKDFDRLTVISSSGPAFVYYLISVFKELLSDLGLEEETDMLPEQLFLGSSLMASKSDHHIDELISQVTSKKGITIEGINSLKESSINKDISKAFESSILRSQEIADQVNGI